MGVVWVGWSGLKFVIRVVGWAKCSPNHTIYLPLIRVPQLEFYPNRTIIAKVSGWVGGWGGLKIPQPFCKLIYCYLT